MEREKQAAHREATVWARLNELYGNVLSPSEIEDLATAIQPYLIRTRLPFTDAIATIAANYLTDGKRVRSLNAAGSPAQWQHTVAQVLRYATHISGYSSAKAMPPPLIQAACDDISRKLPNYNFEATFDQWITVTILRRLRPHIYQF